MSDCQKVLLKDIKPGSYLVQMSEYTGYSTTYLVKDSRLFANGAYANERSYDVHGLQTVELRAVYKRGKYVGYREVGLCTYRSFTRLPPDTPTDPDLMPLAEDFTLYDSDLNRVQGSVHVGSVPELELALRERKKKSHALTPN